MKFSHFLLSAAFIQFTVAVVPGAHAAGATTGQPIVVAQAEDQVAAARRSLEAAEKALQQAEDTGGDIRAARKSTANAMKALRAAEAAAGMPAGTGDVAPSEGPEPKSAPAPAQKAEPVPGTVTGPKPYEPPVVPKKAEPPAAAEKPANTSSPKKDVAPPPAKAAKPDVPPAPVQPKVEPKPPVKPAAPKPAPTERSAKPPSPPPARTTRRPDGEIMRTYPRPNGYRILEFTDARGRLIRRIQVDPAGNETVLIDAERPRGAPPLPDYVDPLQLPPPGQRPRPREGYVLNGDQAGPGEIEDTLRAAPIQRPMRGYSLDEIRRDPRIRGMVRRVDLDTITFDFGSARVPDDQVRKLRSIGIALGRIVDRNPNEVFLIEGHTDAVGTDLANLELSDQRAGSVASILTRYFNVPPRNLVAQGYGERDLKVPVDGPERQNRRVTIRRITPLLDGY